MTRAAPSSTVSAAQLTRTLCATGALEDLPPPFRHLDRRDPHHTTVDVAAVPVHLRTAANGRWVHAVTTTTRAAALDDHRFRAAAAMMIEATITALRGAAAHPIVRMWNFVPNIATVSVDGDRYRTFNAGRAQAFAALAPTLPFLPAASGLGHAGESLVVHAMAVQGDARTVENPRQIPSWRYSRVFGDRPPMFARACHMRSADSIAFFASGTASVLGERSTHGDDFDGQLQETLRNLDALCVEAALVPRDALRSLRVHLRPQDATRVHAASTTMSAWLPSAESEFVIAPLCRPELAIEIEGCAWDPRA